jgi:hypothetical protein
MFPKTALPSANPTSNPSMLPMVTPIWLNQTGTEI